MALRTPLAYQASLQDERVIYYRGERVKDVTAHPVLRVAVQHNGTSGHRHPSYRFDRDREPVGMRDRHRHRERGVPDRIDLKYHG